MSKEKIIELCNELKKGQKKKDCDFALCKKNVLLKKSVC